MKKFSINLLKVGLLLILGLCVFSAGNEVSAAKKEIYARAGETKEIFYCAKGIWSYSGDKDELNVKLSGDATHIWSNGTQLASTISITPKTVGTYNLTVMETKTTNVGYGTSWLNYARNPGDDEKNKTEITVYVFENDERYITKLDRDETFFMNKRSGDYMNFGESYGSMGDVFMLTNKTIGPNNYRIVKKAPSDYFEKEVTKDANGNVTNTKLTVKNAPPSLYSSDNQNKTWYYMYSQKKQNWIQLNINDYELKIFNGNTEAQKENGVYILEKGLQYNLKVVEYTGDTRVKATTDLKSWNGLKNEWTKSCTVKDVTETVTGSDFTSYYTFSQSEGALQTVKEVEQIRFCVDLIRTYAKGDEKTSNILLDAKIKIVNEEPIETLPEHSEVTQQEETVETIETEENEETVEIIPTLWLDYNGGYNETTEEYKEIAFDNESDGNFTIRDDEYVYISKSNEDRSKDPNKYKVVKPGFKFIGWTEVKNDASTKLEPDSVINVEDTDTIYALWEKVQSVEVPNEIQTTPTIDTEFMSVIKYLLSTIMNFLINNVLPMALDMIAGIMK